MKEKVIKFLKFHWLLESNRPMHIIVLLLIGLCLDIEAVFAASATAEFKDWLWNGQKGGAFGWLKGNGFDWLDFLASMIGGFLGCLIKFLLLN